MTVSVKMRGGQEFRREAAAAFSRGRQPTEGGEQTAKPRSGDVDSEIA